MNGHSPVPASPPAHGKPVLLTVPDDHKPNGHQRNGYKPNGHKPNGFQPGGAKAARVLLCGEIPVVRHALATMLDAAAGISVTGTTGSGMEAIILARKLRPDVVVTDLQLGGIPGLEMVRRLRDDDQDLAPQVVVFAINDTGKVIGDVLRAGVSGVLDQHASPDDLICAVRLAARGQVMLAPGIAQWLVDWFVEQPGSCQAAPEAAVHSLTRREREVMALIARGLSADDIAVELTIGVATARTHIYRVRCKLGARDRAHIVALAYQSGLMQPAS